LNSNVKHTKSTLLPQCEYQYIFATFSNAAVHQWLAVDWLVVWGIYLFIYFLFAHFIIFQARPVQSLRKVHWAMEWYDTLFTRRKI